ncbi:hypothetical protein ABZ330_14395 [Streptomyces sp. NPDC006172]|uniref:hypothetical protein n=1 Tax=Streptomyces sp. NPDC006172 TaxID=3154470 RepID=UPI0033EF0A20
MHLHSPGRCMRRTGRRNVCGADLISAPQLNLGHNHTIVQTQTEINGIALHPFGSADAVFVEVDQLLSGLAGSLGPSERRKMSAACRSTWETAFTDATDSQSPLGGWRFHERRVRILTPEFLQREYTEGGKSFSTIAREVGVPTAHVVRHTRTSVSPSTEEELARRYSTTTGSASNTSHINGPASTLPRKSAPTARPSGAGSNNSESSAGHLAAVSPLSLRSSMQQFRPTFEQQRKRLLELFCRRHPRAPES